MGINKPQPHILTEEELKVLHAEERSILKVIHELCVKFNITYYIIGGTLLGAVRHKGFIPWDDDIDIAMYRKDFAKFEKIAKKHLPKEFFLQTYKTDKGYPQIMPKIRKNGTILENVSEVNLKMHKGVFVDIFMLDYEKRYSKRIEKKSKIHRFLAYLLSVKKRKCSPKKINNFVASLVPTRFIMLLNNIFVASNKQNKFTMNYSSQYSIKKQSFPSSYYGVPKLIKFDDLEVLAPSEYEKILASVYGNYMELPPVEKRGLHHKINRFEI